MLNLAVIYDFFSRLIKEKVSYKVSFFSLPSELLSLSGSSGDERRSFSILPFQDEHFESFND